MSDKRIVNFRSAEYGDINEAVVAAFACCREKNHPVTVMIDVHKCKLYPSGRMVDLDTGRVNNEIEW